MSETEEWTVVSSSKVKQKKAVPPPPPQVQATFSGNSKNTQQSRDRKGQGSWQGSKKAPSNLVKREDNASASSSQPGISKYFQSLAGGQRPPPSYKINNRKDARNHGKKSIQPTAPLVPIQTTSKIANKSADLIRSNPERCGSESSNKFQKTVPSNHPVPTSSANALQKPTQAKVIHPEIVGQRHNECPQSSSTATASVDTSSATTAAAPKKKKQKSKAERRKKREEMFYQTLYQNKDSHIQFVSADVIRKLQNDQKAPAPKPSTSRKCFPCANLQPNLIQSFNTMHLNEGMMEEFPCLTPSTSTSERKQEIRPVPRTSTSTSSSNQNEDLNSTHASSPSTSAEAKISETEKYKQSLLTPKVSIETPSVEASTPKTNPPPSTPAPQSSTKGKKSKQPMIIDVSSLIVSKKKERELQRKFASPNTPFGRPGGLKKENFKITAGNPLDSSGPGVINRGKIRQKKKKPTKLKLTILRSRALKKILFEEKSKQTMERAEEESIIVNEKSPVETVKTEVDDEVAPPLSRELVFVEDTAPIKEEAKSSDNTVSDEEDLTELIQLKNEETLNKENESTVSSIDSNDMSLKFIKLLDEVSMLKVADENFSPEIEVAVKSAMHSRKFRDYCDMYTSKELHGLVLKLLSELFRFQDRLYHTDPIKFKTKRRFVPGLKEALSYLNLNKIQLLIIAADIEKNPEPGGLDEKITQILTAAKGKSVPYIFSGSKYTLGKPIRIKTPISIISILDKQNCEETFRALMEEAAQLRVKYHNDFATKAKELKSVEK